MRSALVRSSMIGYTLLFAVSLLIAGWQGTLEALFLPSGWSTTGFHLLLGVGLAAAVLALSEFARRSFLWARRLDVEFARLLGALGAWDALVLAVASGIAEETFFRGILQPVLGLWVTSLAFGLLHYPMNRQMIPWTGIAIGMGLVLGVVFETTGSLLTVAVAHGLINFVELGRIGGGAQDPV